MEVLGEFDAYAINIVLKGDYQLHKGVDLGYLTGFPPKS
jgi:hypothetical protein